MALFEKTPAGAAKTALIAAQARVDEVAAAVKKLTDRRAPAVERHEAARAAADATVAAIKNADLDAVAAEETGRELPDLSVLYAQRDQAALKVRATAARLEKIDAELLAAEDELDDATEAHARATRGDTLTRMAKALEPAKAVDDELIGQGRGFGIADMIDQALAAAEKCATPPILDVELWTHDNSIIRRPPDRAIGDVARGASFVNPRDARKYAAQVEALRTEIAAKKQAQPRVDQVG